MKGQIFFSLLISVVFFGACTQQPSDSTSEVVEQNLQPIDTVETDPSISQTSESEAQDDFVYNHTLEIFQEYAFNHNLLGTVEDAKAWLESEGLPFSDVYSDEEGVYKLSFVIRSVGENTACEFNFEYNSDYWESCRHIETGIEDPLQQMFFFNQMDAWLVDNRGLSHSSTGCFERHSGEHGHFWEEQLKYCVEQTVLQYPSAQSKQQWIELRFTPYKDVAKDDIVECD